jgi:adenylate cyclase
MRKISIRSLLALSMGVLVLIATAAVLGIALMASRTNTFELLNDRMVLILDGIENEVRAKLQSAGTLVDGFAAEMQTEHFQAAGTEEILDALTIVLATAPGIEVLVYWDRNMVRRGVYRDKDGNYEHVPPSADADPRLRNRLASIPPDVKHVWGEPFEQNGVTFLNVAARVPSSRADVAFVGAGVSLDQFSRFVASVGDKYSATAFILYGDDGLLAHPMFSGAAGEVVTHGVIPASEAGDPVIADLSAGVPVDFASPARAKGDQVIRVDVEGTNYLVLLRNVGNFGNKEITVGAYYRQTAFGDSLMRLRMSGVAGVVVAILAVVAAIVLGGFISRPVRRLGETAGAVARLELQTASRPSGSPIREIDDQARAFNLMLDGLKVFETYVPRQLVQRLIALGNQETVVSETREVSVMFTDVVGFTALSDRMGADETAAFLNRHFGLLAGCITGEAGTIDKYIGDAVMAFWGAPDRTEDHAARAVAAARCIAATVTTDNERRARKGLKPVRMRIGIHSGSVVVGNIGAPGRVNYTIVGDTVNVAQRIESLGHRLDDGADVTVLMSARTAQLAGVDADGEDVGEHQLAGVTNPVAVVRLHTHLPLKVPAGGPEPVAIATGGTA